MVPNPKPENPAASKKGPKSGQGKKAKSAVLGDFSNIDINKLLTALQGNVLTKYNCFSLLI